MISFTTAEKALKSFYLSVLAEQLNTNVNPLLAKIEQTSSDVWGKEIIKLATYGLNGGIKAGEETGGLPKAGGNNYAQFVLTLKNFYGQLEISDKAIRASQNNAGAFVNLLNAEMEGLLKASRFNFGRMLYGDGSGKLADIVEYTAAPDNSYIKVDRIDVFNVGMIIDIATSAGTVNIGGKGRKIIAVDRANSVIRVDYTPATAFAAGCMIYIQDSKDYELTGLEAIFGDSTTLYGLNRADYDFLKPYKKEVGALSFGAIQDAVDYIEQYAGGTVDFIACSFDARRAYIDLCASKTTNIDVMNLDGGYKALSYSGIPIVADKFAGSGTMYLLNTADFKLHQLCDWRWLEGAGGSILKQNASYATYSATLVKYADLLCERPMGQAKLSGIGA